MSIVVVATISPKPEHTDAVAAAFAGIIPQVHAEDGCELYALHRAGPDRGQPPGAGRRPGQGAAVRRILAAP